MVQTPAPAPLSLPARLMGVLVSPRETFASVAAHPRWFDVLAVSLGIFVAAQTWLLSTEVGRQALVDQQVTQLESFGVTVDDAMYANFEQQAKYAPYIQAAAVLVFSPLFLVVVAGIFRGVFAALGGEATFRQVFAVLAHTSVLNIVQAVFVTPLNYARESLGSPTTLASFAPMLADGSFLGNFLGAIDLFIVWSIALMAIGLAVLYRRRTGPILVTLLAVYALIALVIAAVKAALGGS